MHPDARKQPILSLALRAIASLAALAVVLALTDGPLEARRRARVRRISVSKPNIVVIMTDDMREADMVVTDPLEVMPTVRTELREKGATFTNTFSTFSLCCPARATFLTGQYAHNHGVMSNSPPEGGYDKFKELHNGNTLADWLQAAGYDTVHIGKFLNGYGKCPGLADTCEEQKEVPLGWTEWFATTGGSTYRFYDYYINANCHTNSDDSCVEHYGSNDEDYQTDVLKNKAVDFIQRQASSTKPFFMVWMPLAPHDDTTSDSSLPGPEPAPRHDGLLGTDPNDMLKPPSFDEADVTDKPSFMQQYPPLTEEQKDRNIPMNYKRRLESLMAVDEATAAIIVALKEAEKWRNTILIFTSDNGYLLGEHRAQGKIRVYEESVQIPLVIAGPGIRIQTLDPLVANVDLTATILALARASAGLPQDGRSLVPLLGGRNRPRRTALLLESSAMAPYDTGYFAFEAVRSDSLVYAEHHVTDPVSGEETLETELYDLALDSYQEHSEHANPAYDATEAQLQESLNALRTCAAESCWR